MICRCGKTMKGIFCWDNAQQTDMNHAFNVYACDACGRLMKQDVWEDVGEIWIGLAGVEDAY